MNKILKIAAVITLALSAFVTPVLADEPDLCAIAYMCPNCSDQMIKEPTATEKIFYENGRYYRYIYYYDYYWCECGYSFTVPTGTVKYPL